MAAVLNHPYEDGKGTWVRGSFHGHCSENSGCSSVPLAEGVRRYHQVADFVTLTDHNFITALEEMRSRYPDLVFLEGFENGVQEDMVFAGESVPPLYVYPLGDALKIRGEGVLTFACHPLPHASGAEYWTFAKLVELGSWPDGIEVYNGHYGTEAAQAVGRQPLGTPLWDEVLTAGHRLWGYANDDFHDPSDFGNAWNMVRVEEVTPKNIIAAARAGQCYGTTGLLLREFGIEGALIHVELEREARGRFVGPGGKVLAGDVGSRFAYRVDGEAYVRFEAEGEAGRIFLQPAFLEE